ncbi:MFS transporter [Ochrobactrum sp. MYb29]|uniref:MFS transporter n=1 Tax=Brucella pituitosa TaxID=571256 RepID=UPI000C2717EB|nr:MFS transporter [Brucella pituitosa]PJO49863.1 MFS transporter [Brucella pituitosa]PRA83700.1 MFS transporter [Ochrobactrum sp. MYb29]
MTIAPSSIARPSSRTRLFCVLAGLYLAQGIPTYLFAAALPPILREQNVSRTAIGMFSILLLPMVLKFAWAPLVDRFRPWARSHRAGWVVLTQSGIIAAIVCLIPLGPDNVTRIFVVGFIASLLLATQDIATDGYAAKYLNEADRPLGNAIQGGAVAFGVLIGGTLGLVLYHHAGWAIMLGTISFLSLIPLIAALSMRETDPAPLLDGQALSRPSIMHFLRRAEARQILWIALIYRASEGLMKAMEGPYLVDAGVPLDVIGYLSGAAAATAGIAGSAIAAVLLRRNGVAAVLGLLGGLRTICFLLFTLHAFGALGEIWPLYGASAFQTIIRYMEIVALYSLFMSVTSPDQPGTDFTILACAQIVVYLAGSMVSGILADRLGYGLLFALAAALSGLAVLATISMLKTLPTTGVDAVRREQS